MSRSRVVRRCFALLACSGAILLGLAAATPAAFIELRGGRIDTSSAPEASAAALQSTAGQDGESLAFVQFDGPIQPEWLEACAAAGAEIHHSVPEFAYLVTLGAGEAEAIRALPHVAWVGSFPPALRVAPELRQTSSRAAAGTQVAVVILSEGLLDPAVQRDPRYTRVSSRLTPMGWRETRAVITTDLLDEVAAIPTVFHIEREPVRQLMGERGAQTAAGNYVAGANAPVGPGYVAWLTSHGLTGGTLSDGTPLVAQVQDDGLDQGIATNAPGTAHADILGRIHGIYNATTDPLGDGQAGHGQINAGIIMANASIGTTDAGGYRLGQGLAPLARVYATKVFRNSGSWDIGGDTLTSLATDAQNHGVLFSNNSWGSDDDGAYTVDSAELDALTRDADPTEAGNQPITYFVAAGNAGPSNGTIGSPATGKNVIAVGAGENSDADGTDGCATGPSDANSIRDLVNFSSRGPCDDTRFGVTVFAVGTHVQGPASTSPSYDGTGVCDKYWPAGQTNYARSSGTSHSTPITCGAGMIVHEFFNRTLSLLGHTSAPSPAMIKAVLVATATDRAGGNNGAGGTLTNVPNAQQGWGAVNLTPLVDNPTRLVTIDQTHTFTASGQTFERQVTVSDPSKPLRIALCWTDQPALPAAAVTLINDLDLEVVGAGGTYLGNVFTSGSSVTGGSADRRNTTECVFIAAPAGSYTIRVRAFNIAGDGVPNSGGALDQDFALFALNATSQTQAGTIDIEEPVVGIGGQIHIRVSDSGLANSAPINVTLTSDNPVDSETVSLSEVLAGSGVLAGTLSVAAGAATPGDGTLQVADGGTVTATYQDADTGSGPGQATDTAPVDGVAPSISNVTVTDASFDRVTIGFTTSESASGTVTLGATCGAADVVVSSGQGTSHSMTVTDLTPCTTYRFRIAAEDPAGNRAEAPVGPCFQATTLATAIIFDDDFEPTAADGWAHSAAAGTDNWAVRTSANAHSATHVYSQIPGTSSVSDALLVTPAFAGGGQMSFWHTYAFENTYDGGVIEISTNGGTSWNDLAPHITLGGYNGTIDTGFSSPIAGQSAWTGGSLGTMTQVLVDLASYTGQTVQVRFRFCSDNGVASGGWEIDDIQAFTTQPCQEGFEGNQDLSGWTYRSDLALPGSLGPDFPGDPSVSGQVVADNDGDGSGSDLRSTIGGTDGLSLTTFFSPPGLITHVPGDTLRVDWRIRTVSPPASGDQYPMLRMRWYYGANASPGAGQVMAHPVVVTPDADGRTYTAVFDQFDFSAPVVSADPPPDPTGITLALDVIDFEPQVGGCTIEVDSVTITRYDAPALLSTATLSRAVSDFTDGGVSEPVPAYNASDGVGVTVAQSPSEDVITSALLNPLPDPATLIVFGEAYPLAFGGVGVIPFDPGVPGNRLYLARFGLERQLPATEGEPPRVDMTLATFRDGGQLYSAETHISEYVQADLELGSRGLQVDPSLEFFTVYMTPPEEMAIGSGSPLGDRLGAHIRLVDLEDAVGGAIAVRAIEVYSMPLLLLP